MACFVPRTVKYGSYVLDRLYNVLQVLIRSWPMVVEAECGARGHPLTKTLLGNPVSIPVK